MSEVQKNFRKKNYYKNAGKKIPPRFIDHLQGIFITSPVNDNFKISKSAFYLLRSQTTAIPDACGKPKQSAEEHV